VFVLQGSEPTPGEDLVGDIPLMAAVEIQDAKALQRKPSELLPSEERG